MSVIPFIGQGIIYALGTELSKQSLTITAQKIVNLILYFSGEDNDDEDSKKSAKTKKLINHTLLINNFIEKNHLKLKTDTATAILEDIHQKSKFKLNFNTAIELNCQALTSTVESIAKELELLRNKLSHYELTQKKYWFPPKLEYKQHLERLDYLINQEFETRFKLLKDVVIFNGHLIKADDNVNDNANNNVATTTTPASTISKE